ncbi:hypothetical protein UFOVP1339_23 [uncultured Caudovirales phage]|uniref:Uncharacterized protein n=1 Tax=uncultured Caudovirales phage TaxID=2100421 RepID=A0A6J5S116_9CAUD|nr:hypothetical protein UFOVP1339_23 [uncultured Caudovirales phage]
MTVTATTCFTATKAVELVMDVATAKKLQALVDICCVDDEDLSTLLNSEEFYEINEALTEALADA